MGTESLTHWRQLHNPDYLGAYSLQPGEERTIKIIRVEKKQVKGSDGKSEDCTVAVLENEKPMILNVTNAKTLSKLFGTPYIEKWANRTAIVRIENVKAFGERVDALRIKNTLPKDAAADLPELTPDNPKWDGAMKAVVEGTATIEQIQKRYYINHENIKLLKEAY